MGKKSDVRWEQRFMNFRKALTQLANGLDIKHPSELEQEGIIQRFEYSFDLSWKTLKDYLEFQGVAGITDSRDTFKEAFNYGLIENGEVWMEMIESRNLTSHTYNEETASKILESIRNEYYSLFRALNVRLNKEKKR